MPRGAESGVCCDCGSPADYALGLIHRVKLPRKLKICFGNGVRNDTHATFRDMGFVADAAKPSRLLYHIKSMVDMFTRYGEYEKRAMSRSRYLQNTLGIDGIKRVFAEKPEQNLAQGGLDITARIKEISKTGEGEISDTRVIKQKQQGLYTVSFHPFGGNPAPDFFRRLCELIREMEEVRVRLTPDEGLYVINLTAKEAEKVLTACLERVKQEGFPDGVLPAIHISGCPSSCSAHQIGAIGMRGGKKPTPERPRFSFTVYENGSPRFGEERFGRDLANILEEDIPEFLVTLGRAVAGGRHDL